MLFVLKDMSRLFTEWKYFKVVSLRVTTMSVVFLWVVTQCNLVNKSRCFTGIYYHNPNV